MDRQTERSVLRAAWLQLKNGKVMSKVTQVTVEVKLKVRGCIVGPTSYWLIPHSNPFLIQFFQNLTLKIQCHDWGQNSKSQSGSYRHTSLSFHVGHPIPGIQLFQNLTLKNIAQGHIVGPISYRLPSLSFQVNWPFHSWDMANSKFDLENQGQGHGWGERLRLDN